MEENGGAIKVFESIVALQNALFDERKRNHTVGLVPTMGALHEGHASLVRRAVAENDVVVVSIFVNPTQFNDKGDLARYPRTPDADRVLLARCGAHYVFAPSVHEMYPTEDRRQFDFPPVTTVMEGAHRPGHFNGVCQVVSRLFYIVRPDRAYFGEKDWQQIAVVKRLLSYLALPIEIVECPTVRCDDGLAMSSRNALLAPDERAVAPQIYRVLRESRVYARAHTVQETHRYVVESINAVDGLTVEYFSIVDSETLLDITSWDEARGAAGCVTVLCGRTPIRLIDHTEYKPTDDT